LVLVAKLSQKQRSQLFKKIVKSLNAKGKMAKILLCGTSEKRLQSMFKIAQKHLENKHNIKVVISPLFEENIRMGLQEYLGYVAAFLSGKNCIIIVEIMGIHHHWTCITAITEKTIQLIDSDGLNHFKISTCRLTKIAHPNKHCLHPSRTWSVWLEG
jgi:hypothetical protein